MRFSAVSTLALCGLAAAREMSLMERQLATITGVLTNVQTITNNLDTAINGYNGGDPTAILDGSKKLIEATTQGTEQVNGATAVSVGDAVQIQKLVQALQKNVEQTIGDLVNKKAVAKSNNLGGETYKQLQLQYNGAKALSTAISAKVPPSLAQVAVQLSQGILTAVQKGVDAYADIQSQVYNGPGATAGGAAAGGAAAGGAARVSNAVSSSAPTATAAATTAAAAAPAATTSAHSSADAAFKPVSGMGFLALAAAVLAF